MTTLKREIELALLDHLLPRSKGGTYAQGNLKLAHSRRSPELLPQMNPRYDPDIEQVRTR